MGSNPGWRNINFEQRQLDNTLLNESDAAIAEAFGPGGAKLLQMGAQVEEQVTPLFLAAASFRSPTLRYQLR